MGNIETLNYEYNDQANKRLKIIMDQIWRNNSEWEDLGRE